MFKPLTAQKTTTATTAAPFMNQKSDQPHGTIQSDHANESPTVYAADEPPQQEDPQPSRDAWALLHLVQLVPKALDLENNLKARLASEVWTLETLLTAAAA